MFIPLRTDRRPKRRPVITESLIIINMVVYLIGVAGNYFQWFTIEGFTDMGHFDPQRFVWWQLLTYQFLHDPYGIWHLLFNMLFLWVFGCAVEGRFSRLGFLAFYLVAGSFAAIAHGLVTPAPVIGASGSIAGVSGAFIALFPRSRILLASIIGLFMIPALWLIGFYILLDFLRQAGEWLGGGSGGVAYAAHLAGYAYGFALAFALLATKIIKREEFDVFYLFKQWRRRAAFRAANRSAEHVSWDAGASRTTPTPRRVAADTPVAADQKPIIELRGRISALLAEGHLAAAAGLYPDLLALHPEAVFSETQQLDLANHLYNDDQHEAAAAAYENYLSTYPAATQTDEVRLLLTALYTRHLPDQHARARELLDIARQNSRLGALRELADQLHFELSP